MSDASAPYTMLFLCTGNSARSILAESIMNRVGKGKIRAFSAGSHPKGAVHPAALKLLRSLGYPTEGLRSKSWNAFAATDAPSLDFIITVCGNAAGETCPIWPGRPISAHWGVPDPAAVEGSEAEVDRAFAQAYQQLEAWICSFVSLPIDKRDALSIKRSMDAIGTRAPAESL